jgi:hypothetical protein
VRQGGLGKLSTIARLSCQRLSASSHLPFHSPRFWSFSSALLSHLLFSPVLGFVICSSLSSALLLLARAAFRSRSWVWNVLVVWKENVPTFRGLVLSNPSRSKTETRNSVPALAPERHCLVTRVCQWQRHKLKSLVSCRFLALIQALFIAVEKLSEGGSLSFFRKFVGGNVNRLSVYSGE